MPLDAIGQFRHRVGRLWRRALDAAAWYVPSPPYKEISYIEAQAQAPDVPVDIVYTWVDASVADVPRVAVEESRESRHESRWISRDELKYSLRSVENYAPWVRRVYIVTNGQELPAWLDTAHPQLTIITHANILDKEFLPTFNSHVIESALHHIDGLSEHFLYMNDDVMLLRPVSAGAFFTREGKIRAPVTSARLPEKGIDAAESPAVWAAKNARDVIFAAAGVCFYRRFGHGVHPQRKSISQAAEHKYAHLYQSFRHNIFRAKTDLLCCSFLHYCEGFLQSVVEMVHDDCRHVRIRRATALSMYSRMLSEKGSARAAVCACLNDHVATDRILPEYEKHLQSFMVAYYPHPSRFEKVVRHAQ